ncbi:unnamed protein product [Adineta steineri]|uniref:Uncharacterized protein n=1 Tax=Adineta steineri TaxID=433720 RepID=A0A815Y1N9_9BILA|nr:unnamed protein product [Adineta steineri]CAF1282121.1 unnamed protein product [Adineta steineri]CAF1322541.1 unnamed protein product [Adineta steineri]CAF1564167.1 unnamed protein product [Adineta steineri]CAF1564921.1 unnamed protein product [Adineta steineri]
MSGLFNLSLNKILLLLIICSIFEINESRFVWDFGSYCLNYCAKTKFKLTPVSICSCQWISSNYRRSPFHTILNNNNNNVPFKIK